MHTFECMIHTLLLDPVVKQAAYDQADGDTYNQSSDWTVLCSGERTTYYLEDGAVFINDRTSLALFVPHYDAHLEIVGRYMVSVCHTCDSRYPGRKHHEYNGKSNLSSFTKDCTSLR